MCPDLVVITPYSAFGTGSLFEVWRRRDLLHILMLRELQVRYRQAVFGILWALLQPGLMMLLFWVAFGKVAGLGAIDGVPYPLFALSGLVIWQIFASGVQHAANSLIENERLITKVYFPRIMLPISSIGVSLVDFSVAMVVLMSCLALSGVFPQASIWLLFPAVLLTVSTAMGVGLFLAALNVRYRDVRYVLTLLMQAWLMATPVAYPMHLVPGGLRSWFELNPMAGAVDLFRSAVLGTPVDSGLLVKTTAISLVILLAALSYFHRTERGFADRI